MTLVIGFRSAYCPTGMADTDTPTIREWRAAVGARIAYYRRGIDITQEALAESVGVSTAAVGQWETGATIPAPATSRALVLALGCTWDDLYSAELDDAARVSSNGAGEVTGRGGARGAPDSTVGRAVRPPDHQPSGNPPAPARGGTAAGSRGTPPT